MYEMEILMDKNSIIDKKTFEVCAHAEDHPDVFVCDKIIAPVVALFKKECYHERNN